MIVVVFFWTEFKQEMQVKFKVLDARYSSVRITVLIRRKLFIFFSLVLCGAECQKC